MPAGPEELRLQAGSLSLGLEGCDARDVRLGDAELVRRIHVTLRGPDWETVEPRLESLNVETEADRTVARFEAVHGELFRWVGAVVLRPDGIEYEVDGTAESDFETSRLGLCVLHATAGYAGCAYSAEGPHGVTRGRLPADVAAQPVVDGIQQALFDPMRSLTVELAGGVRLRFNFEGDLFELEDQRNWTDASFKSYCTPLAVPFPRRMRPGDTVHQRIVVTLEAAPSRRPASGPPPELTVEGGTGLPVPPVGVTVRDPGGAELTRELAPSFLRLEVDAEDAETTVEAAAELAAQSDAALDVALYAKPGPLPATVTSALAAARPARVAVLHRDSDVTDPALVRELSERLPGVPVGGGTDRHFVDVNRRRPQEPWSLLCWPLNPQAHASDERSILETTEVHRDLVRTARSFAPDAQLCTWAQLVRAPHVDERQADSFAAVFTLASLTQLASAGISAAAFHELWGPRGVAWDGGDGSWRGLSGPRSPSFHVLAAAATLVGQELLATSSVPGLAVLGTSAPAEVTLFLGNLTPERRAVRLDRLADRARFARLSDTNRSDASMIAGFLAGGSEAPWPASLELEPYELVVARLDRRRLVRGIQ